MIALKNETVSVSFFCDFIKGAAFDFIFCRRQKISTRSKGRDFIVKTQNRRLSY